MQLVSFSLCRYCLNVIILGYYYLCNCRFILSVCLSVYHLFKMMCPLVTEKQQHESSLDPHFLKGALWVIGCRLNAYEFCSVIENAISNALLLSYQLLPAVSLALISIGKDLHQM